MRNQQFWLLSLLGLGIFALPQIAAVSYDVARLAYDIVNHTVSDVNQDGCFQSFYNAMMNATDDSQNENGTDPSTVDQLTQEFLLCILTSEGATDKPEQNTDAPEDQEIPDSQYQPGAQRMGKMTSDISREAIEQIEHFEYQPNYDDLSERLIRQFHAEFKKFLQTGLYQVHKQENYVNLIKKMLYAVSATILSEDLISGVNAAIDKQLEPYIVGVITDRSYQPSRMFYKKSGKPKITKLNIGPLYEPPDCDSEGFGPTIECVYWYAVALVELERMHTPESDADQIWEPFGARFLETLERLLLKIIGQTPPREYPKSDKIASLLRIFKVRSLVVSCLDLLREKYDVENLGIVISGAESEAISKCLKSAKKRANNLISYFTVLDGMGKIDPGYFSSLEEDTLKRMLARVMSFYPGLRELRYLVRRQIKEGILTNNNNSDGYYAGTMIKKWNESSIKDVNLRFATLFSVNVGLPKECDLNWERPITANMLATHICWGPVFADILRMEAVLHKDGLSMDVGLHQHPVIMNYIYIARQELSTCIPVKETARSSPLDLYTISD